MRQALLVLFLLALTTACHNEEEILPAPAPAASGPSPIAKPQAAKRDRHPSFDVRAETFQYGSFRDMPFRILAPKNYDSTKTYPLHIFLHGIGERGTDNEAQLEVGGAHFEADSIREKYPAFIIFPQCPDSYFWFSDAMTDKLHAFIDSITTVQNINRKNISIGGFSMGAYGAFAMVARNPELFKSAIAISGDGDETKADRMAQSRWRLFAGERDTVVPSRKTEKMAKALAKAGASVSFTLYPDADHGATWHRAFSEADLFQWLFSKE